MSTNGASMPLEDIGRLVLAKRGGRGVRAVAKEIGISHATLSRVERGFLPDLENYEKICNWLGIAANTSQQALRTSGNAPQVHFRREKTATAETAAALATMILAAQAAWPKRHSK
jgi:transcriptional regulator with XRE-family HTH domain